MGMIFDDISVEETEGYRNYNDLNSYEALKTKKDYYELMKEVDFANSNLMGTGVILSYGEGFGLMPSGTFIVTGFEDRNGKRISDSNEIVDGFVVLKQIVEDEDDYAIAPDAGKILIPFKEFRKMCDSIEHNDAIIESFLPNVGELVVSDVADLEKANEEDLAERKEGSTVSNALTGLQGVTIDEVGAIYTNGDGTERGTNYKLYPFRAGMFKLLFKDQEISRTHDNGPDKDAYDYVGIKIKDPNYGVRRKIDEPMVPEIPNLPEEPQFPIPIGPEEPQYPEEVKPIYCDNEGSRGR